MADVIYFLKQAPTEAEAERLVNTLEHLTGVTDATLNAAARRLNVTFEPMRTGGLELERVIRGEGFEIAGQDELGFTPETPGYTREAYVQLQGQEAATDLTRDQEIDLGGGLGAEST